MLQDVCKDRKKVGGRRLRARRVWRTLFDELLGEDVWSERGAFWTLAILGETLKELLFLKQIAPSEAKAFLEVMRGAFYPPEPSRVAGL